MNVCALMPLEYGRAPMRQQKNTSDLPAVSQWLFNARMRTGKSQGQIAQAADIDPTYVGKIELGQKQPSRKVIYRLAAALVLDKSDSRAAKHLLNEGLKAGGFAPEEEPDPSIETPLSVLVQQIIAKQGGSLPDIELTPEQTDKLISDIEQYAEFQFSRIVREIDDKKQ